MSDDGEDSFQESSPLFQTYFQELKQIYPEVDNDTLKAVMVHYKVWDEIINALSDEEKRKGTFTEFQQSRQEETVNEHNEINVDRLGISLAPTSYDSPKCRLYLPQSLMSYGIDLNLFGSFDSIDDTPIFFPMQHQFSPVINMQQMPQDRHVSRQTIGSI